MARANLADADLTHANLADADLRGAQLRGANLSAAELEGAVRLAERAAVLRPFRRLQRHLEQARRVQRTLDLRVLVGGGIAVVRRRPPEIDRKRRRHACCLEHLRRLRHVRSGAEDRFVDVGVSG